MARIPLSQTILLAIVLGSSSFAQNPDSIPSKRTLITQPVDNQNRVTLSGNTRSQVSSAADQGAVPDSLTLDHLLLQLQRPAELSQALDQFLIQLDDPKSANYHKWLTASEFGAKFGLADSDITSITLWLGAQGFVVNQVYPNKTTIDFSGNAAQIRQAFQTEIHYLDSNGKRHLANMQDPQIPAALAPAIKGIVSLHDFMPHSARKERLTQYTVGPGTYAVVPADLATIYNINPLLSRGLTGQGQTIAVIEDTNVYSTADWTTFRNTFGLSSYTTGSLAQVHPGNCTNPGVVADNDGEAILDAEWASAAAPGAAIQVVACSDSTTTFGGLIALQNLLNGSATPPALVSISYGECEAENGAASNATYSAIYQQAVAEGVSVFVSSGDEGAASCDANASYATHGIGVSAFASTPYNVAVGGTDFGDTYSGTTSTYWNSTNTGTFGSAKSYVPEIPWDDSCASNLIAGYLGYSLTYGSSGLCNSSTGKSNFINTSAGSGGPSNCAFGSPSATGIASGSCQGYAKPSWQAGFLGNPNDGVRDIPDVSLFAANGIWGHYYVYCWTDLANGGASCSGAPANWSGAGGTSFSSPIMAGIQALINQSTGTRWGNPNAHYYALAASEYGSGGNASCLSGNHPSTTCTFYDVTLGNMDVVCAGSVNCYGSTGSRSSLIYGALSTSSSAFSPAYASGTGWDFATGIGSVNANSLVTNWGGGTVTAPSSSASYSGLDTSSQGTWTGKYGADGFQIPNDNSSAVPTYASLSFNGAATYTWAFPTTDLRGLQVASGSYTRIASTYYSSSSASFSMHLALTDGNAHRVSFYLLDWSDNGRSETITITDTATNTVLDTEFFAGFNSGQYATWNLKGDVTITVTCTSTSAGDNPLIGGIFFGAASSAATSSATYGGLDTSTQGTWTGKYGSDGFDIANDVYTSRPSYVSLGYLGASTYTWAYPTSDPRALQISSGSSSRIASTYYGATTASFSMHLTLTDGNSHRVSFYLLDWSNNNRTETISITDVATNTVLDTESFASFGNGQYATWNIKGDVIVTVTATSGGAGDNPLIAGIFFGPASSSSLASASFAGVDASTKGNWGSIYGADGADIANDSSVTRPAYVSLGYIGAATYTWASPTSDPRALQLSSGSSTRIASTYYTTGSTSFSIHLNLTDGNAHKVSLYLLDWSNNNRTEAIAIRDTATNTLLNTETFGGFDGGEYAVWNIKGDVLITVTVTSGGAGDNPIVSGLFFN